jgi:mannosyltransferase
MTNRLSTQRQTLTYAVLLAVLLLGLWLRVNRLAVWPLWLDEGFSAFGAQQGFDFIWNVLPTYETHPPLFTALLRLWILIVGDSVTALRSLGVVIGIISLPIIWLAARDLAIITGKDRLLAPVATLALVATSASMIDISRLVRPYYLIILVFATGITALLRLTRHYRTTEKLAKWPWRIYIISAAMMCWLHNLGPLYVAALGLGLLCLIGPINLLTRHLKAFVIGHLLVFLIALPSLLIMLNQLPTWTDSTWLQFHWSSVPRQIQILFGIPGPFGLFATVLLAILGIIACGRANMRVAGALIIIAFAPIALALLLSSFVTPVFLPRTLVACTVPLVILWGLGGGGSKQAVIGWFTTAMLVGFNAQQTYRVEHLPPMQNWYGAIRWLMPQFKPGDQLYAYPNQGALPLRFALRDLNTKVPVRQIPGEIPARDPQGWYPTGSRGVQSLFPARLAEIANDPVSRNAPTIWLIRLDKQRYDKDDVFVRILERNRVQIGHFEDSEINIIGLRQSPPPQKPQP